VVSGAAYHANLYPLPSQVLLGVVYGPGGIYTGTLAAYDDSIKLDIATQRLVKVINSKVVISF
jgi:hypothetical protein